MPTMTSYAPGNFCWCELVTTDQKAAKDFYSKLFGWGITDSPMGPDAFYTMLDIDGKNVGALYGMDKAQLERGVPPHWNVYISTASADETTKKAESLGGKTMLPPFDVMDVGRMSMIQDPTGAMFAVWEARKHIGADLVGELNSFCWWELNTKDTAKAKEFYTNLCGWETGGDANYTEWKSGGQSMGGMMEIKPEWGPVPPNWLSYILVDNCDQSVAKVKELGGSVMMGPQDIENMGRFAVVADPQHAVFALYQRNAK
jgi:predicted enzyme related to lactoylglutathione lyase